MFFKSKVPKHIKLTVIRDFKCLDNFSGNHVSKTERHLIISGNLRKNEKSFVKIICHLVKMVIIFILSNSQEIKLVS